MFYLPMHSYQHNVYTVLWCQRFPGPVENHSTVWFPLMQGTRCSSMVRAFAHGAMSHRIHPSWGGPIELFLVPASAPRLV